MAAIERNPWPESIDVIAELRDGEPPERLLNRLIEALNNDNIVARPVNCGELAASLMVIRALVLTHRAD